MSHTANPRAPKPDPSNAPRETTGPVAADSLAAESLKASGGFAENEDAHALGVKGAQSTLNTTDTQAATALPPASSGAAREKKEALAAGADEKGTTGLKLDALGQPDFDGTHSLLGYSGGPSGGASGGSGGAGTTTSGANVKAGDSDFGASGVSSGGGSGQVDSNIKSTGSDLSGGSAGGAGKSSSGPKVVSSTSATNTASSSTGPPAGSGVRPHVDGAPTYTGAVTGDILPESTFKPKGENLEDADMTQSIPQTKTFTGNVGGAKDPGRLAERDFEGRNNEPNPELRQSGKEDGNQTGNSQGQYDVLQSEKI
ncbi:hypothetical protein LTR84_004859 [Exophiala bonariae]|uniref:Uncharacterized protein n=1 Tax=Exophiala bonariae TaxID=1690606 RepID=A0AAV9NND9_9EURO|nr:hypothetical protein LTR84_004859 [Exophiala bonariae]